MTEGEKGRVREGERYREGREREREGNRVVVGRRRER